MKATLFEIPIETLRIPAHLFLEQGRRHKQILYAPVATPPSFQIYEAMIVPYYEEIISFCEVLYWLTEPCLMNKNNARQEFL